jgi:hypothetical protein
MYPSREEPIFLVFSVENRCALWWIMPVTLLGKGDRGMERWGVAVALAGFVAFVAMPVG